MQPFSGLCLWEPRRDDFELYLTVTFKLPSSGNSAILMRSSGVFRGHLPRGMMKECADHSDNGYQDDVVMML